jgi:hypothetical protein
MKKISQIEKNAILEMHSKLKKPLISEQVVGDSEAKLTKMLADGCVKNGKIVEMDSPNPVYQFAIKQESTKTPGKFRFFFADRRVGSFDGNNKFNFSPSKFSCNAAQQAKLDASTKEKETVVNTDITRELEQYGWKKRGDIAVTDTELGQLYQKHPKYDLYKLKINNAKVGGYTEEQKAFIKLWTENDAYVEKLSPEQLALGTYKPVKVPGSEGLFPGGLIMYRPAVTVPEISVCKDNIKKYYEAFKNRSEELTDSEFNKLKPVVQGCIDKYNGKWGGIFSNVDNYVKVLTGDAPGGPLSTGEDSKFRLKSPRNIKL